MTMRFGNVEELESRITSLPGAEMRAIYIGQTIEKTASPGELVEELEGTSLSASELSQQVSNKPESGAVGIVNMGTGKLATTGTPQYDIVSHEEAFQPVADALRDLGLSVSGEVRTRKDENRALLKAVTGRNFQVDGVTYGIGFQVKNTYDKSGSVILRGFLERESDSTGLILSEEMSVAPLYRQHRGEVDVVAEYREWFTDLLEAEERIRQVLEEAMSNAFPTDSVHTVLRNAGVPKTKLEAVADLIDHEDGVIEKSLKENVVMRSQLYDAVARYVAEEMGDVAFTTEEKYDRIAVRLLTSDSDDLLQSVPDDELPEGVSGGDDGAE